MALVNIDNDLYALLCRSSAFVSLPLTTLLFIQHVTRVRNHIFKHKQTNIHNNCTFIFSFLIFIFTFMIHIAWFLITFRSFSSGNECRITVICGTTTYILIKWSLYMYLTYRLETAFEGSVYAYSTKFLFFWRVFLIVSNFFEIFLLIFTANIELNAQQHGTMACRSAYHNSLLVTIATVDIVACVVNLYLFVRQLNKVAGSIKQMNAKDGKQRETQTRGIQSTASSPSPRVQQNQSPKHSTLNNDNNNTNTQHNFPPAPLQLHMDVASASENDTDSNVNVNGSSRDIYGKSGRNTSVSVESGNHDHDHDDELEVGSVVSVQSNSDAGIGKVTLSTRVSKLRQSLKSNSNSSNKSKSQNERILLNLVRKHVILTALGVGSTIFLMILIRIFGLAIVWYVTLICFVLFS